MSDTPIKGSLAKTKLYPQHYPFAPIEDEEQCCVCNRKIIVGDFVLRHTKTDNVICLNCYHVISE